MVDVLEESRSGIAINDADSTVDSHLLREEFSRAVSRAIIRHHDLDVRQGLVAGRFEGLTQESETIIGGDKNRYFGHGPRAPRRLMLVALTSATSGV
jgi:hypothetical protein